MGYFCQEFFMCYCGGGCELSCLEDGGTRAIVGCGKMAFVG